MTIAIPPRTDDAVSGSEFVEEIKNLSPAERDDWALSEILNGNVPDCLRTPVSITITAELSDGMEHAVTYHVMPDYLAVGSNEDYVRMPMTPLAAEAIGNRFGCMLPTTKMVDDIYAAAAVKLAPVTFHPAAYKLDSVAVFASSSRGIDAQLKESGAKPGELVAGIKKDVVVTAQLSVKPGKVAVYGWHQPNGKIMQPLSLAHDIHYVDYSHGLRMVQQSVLVDGEPMRLAALLADKVLWELVSDEGPIMNPRYREK